MQFEKSKLHNRIVLVTSSHEGHTESFVQHVCKSIDNEINKK